MDRMGVPDQANAVEELVAIGFATAWVTAALTVSMVIRANRLSRSIISLPLQPFRR